MAAETKKLALLRIKQILEEHSGYHHPLKQEDIGDYLKQEYCIEMERKAISRNISMLQEAGMDIQHTRGEKRDGGGYYVGKRLFNEAELRLMIDAVLSSKHLTEKQSKEMIRKLCSLSNEYFKHHVRHVSTVSEWDKSDNTALFTNMQLLDYAINRGKQIRYEYNKYGPDKKLHHSSTSVISPYQMILHNQRYYVMGYSDYWKNMVYHRLDRITNMTIEDENAVPIRSLPGYENGVNYKELSVSMPYMYADKPQYVELLADNNIVDQLIDWFGKGITIQSYSDRQVRVRLKASLKAMEVWALQYLNSVEVISPEDLRKKITDDLKKGVAKYEV